ncbi:MAG: FHA domain-containing protein [Planctomycetaceae bacterium]
MLAQLIPVKGGPPITLTRPITVVGRSVRLCDLALEHTSVSKLHCILVKTDGLIYMRDLGSTNGTRVNGQRVLRGALLPGDQISFSGAAYRIHLGPDPKLSAGSINEGATEMIPIITDSAVGGPPSRSDVRSLSDSDLLPAD